MSLNLGVRNLFLFEVKGRVSLEFTCIQPYIPAQLCLPSLYQRKASILLWHRVLELLGSSWSLPPEWGQVEKTENTPLPHVPVRKCHIPVPAEGCSSPWKAHGQPQQTRFTEHARATIKAAQLGISMVGLCYILIGLNYQETPGQNSRKSVLCEWTTCLVAKRE